MYQDHFRKKWLILRVVRSESSYLAAQGSNTEYATSSRVCRLLSHLSELSIRVFIWVPAPLDGLTKRKNKKDHIKI